MPFGRASVLWYEDAGASRLGGNKSAWEPEKQNIFNPIEVDLRFDAILADLDLPALGKHDAFNDALMTAMRYVKLQNMKKMR